MLFAISFQEQHLKEKLTALGNAYCRVGLFCHIDVMQKGCKCLETKYTYEALLGPFFSSFSTGLIMWWVLEYGIFLIRIVGRVRLQHSGNFFWLCGGAVSPVVSPYICIVDHSCNVAGLLSDV